MGCQPGMQHRVFNEEPPDSLACREVNGSAIEFAERLLLPPIEAKRHVVVKDARGCRHVHHFYARRRHILTTRTPDLTIVPRDDILVSVIEHGPIRTRELKHQPTIQAGCAECGEGWHGIGKPRRRIPTFGSETDGEELKRTPQIGSELIEWPRRTRRR